MRSGEVRRRLESLAQGRIPVATLRILLTYVIFHLEDGRGSWGVAELDECLRRWYWKRNKVPRRLYRILVTHVRDRNANFQVAPPGVTRF